jgi:hypothetical protein
LVESKFTALYGIGFGGEEGREEGGAKEGKVTGYYTTILQYLGRQLSHFFDKHSLMGDK